MTPVNIKIENVDSLRELQNLVSKENIIVCNDVTNSYCTFEIDNNCRFGVAYCNYGIGLSYQADVSRGLVYLMAGDMLICIDYINKQVAFAEKMGSVIYELLADSKNNFVVVFCELDVYVYSGTDLKWKLGFGEILETCEIRNDEYLYIVSESNESFLLSIKDGSIKTPPTEGSH